MQAGRGARRAGLRRPAMREDLDRRDVAGRSAPFFPRGSATKTVRAQRNATTRRRAEALRQPGGCDGGSREGPGPSSAFVFRPRR